MIVIEFLVFVITSGLFFNERFRHNLWAVIIAGVLATGSSLLFMYHLGLEFAGIEKPPQVVTRVVKQVVEKPVAVNSLPASAGKAHTCGDQYPKDALTRGEEGVTSLVFNILTDGTVDAVKVLASSGSKRLDEAAIRCVAGWHYRPAIKNGRLIEAPWKASVKWMLPGSEETAPTAKTEEQTKPKTASEDKHKDDGHAWYDVTSWF